MKKYIATLIILLVTSVSMTAQTWGDYYSSPSKVSQNQQKASITFKNKSDYTMTLKVMKLYGGLYTTVTLSPHSSSTVTFSNTHYMSLKIFHHHDMMVFHCVRL